MTTVCGLIESNEHVLLCGSQLSSQPDRGNLFSLALIPTAGWRSVTEMSPTSATFSSIPRAPPAGRRMQNSFAGVFPLKNAVMRRGAFTLWRHIPLSVLKKTPAFTGTCVRRSGPSSVPPATIAHREVIEILDSSDNLLGYFPGTYSMGMPNRNMSRRSLMPSL